MDAHSKENSSPPPPAVPTGPSGSSLGNADLAAETVVSTLQPVPETTAQPAKPWWRELSPSWRALAVIALLVLLGLLVQALAPVLTPFMFGAILSYVGAPVVSWLNHKGVPRAAGAVLVIVAIAGFVAGMVLIVAPLVSSEVSRIATKMPELLTEAQTKWLPWINQTFGLALAFDLTQLKQLAADNAGVLGDITSKLAGSAKLGGQVLMTALVNLTLIPVVMFYLLRDWPNLVSSVDALVPRSMQPTIRQLASEIDAVLSEFLRGQGMVMIALAAYYCIALKLVGLEFALPVGLVTGLLVFIPFIGFGLGCMLGMLAALTQFSTPGPIIAVAAVFAVGQILEGFLLVPYLVGDRIGLHPLAVIFALMAFGQLFGFVGVLLALPASAALLVAIRMFRRQLVEPVQPVQPQAVTGTSGAP
ncbi:MAG: AI-2E family transporter [Betaproteobacteria bacterium]|nr:MAG: AI-2E family transporter [Betaproteobacteria bacterium]